MKWDRGLTSKGVTASRTKQGHRMTVAVHQVVKLPTRRSDTTQTQPLVSHQTKQENGTYTIKEGYRNPSPTTTLIAYSYTALQYMHTKARAFFIRMLYLRAIVKTLPLSPVSITFSPLSLGAKRFTVPTERERHFSWMQRRKRERERFKCNESLVIRNLHSGSR